MKPISFSCEGTLVVAPEDIAGQILDLTKWPDFHGYGPTPGIEVAEFEVQTPSIVGTKIRVICGTVWQSPSCGSSSTAAVDRRANPPRSQPCARPVGCRRGCRNSRRLPLVTCCQHIPGVVHAPCVLHRKQCWPSPMRMPVLMTIQGRPSWATAKAHPSAVSLPRTSNPCAAGRSDRACV